MHPLQQNSSGGGGERMICFSSISHQQKSIPEDLIRTTHASVVQFEDGTTTCNSFRSSCSNNIIIGKDWRSRKLLATNLDDKNSYCGKSSFSDGNNKKVIHRDVERERRKQMATDFSLLRSLIPYEFLRVKLILIQFIYFFNLNWLAYFMGWYKRWSINEITVSLQPDYTISSNQISLVLFFFFFFCLLNVLKNKL